MGIEDEIKQARFASEHEKFIVNIALTQSQLNANFQRMLKPLGISMQQFNVLRILKGKDPEAVCLADISCRMVDKMSNASRLVDKLFQKGLVQRETCAQDRRQIDVTLTDAGKDILNQANVVVGDAIQRFKSVPKKQLEKANDALDNIRDILHEET
jgi:DNA-binding MarR family transcriptional regulator